MRVIYARKSTESEDRQVLSIDSQVRELREFATRQGLRIDRVYVEAKSAKSPGRPVFGEVCKRIQDGTITELLCWKLDRLARNPVDGGTIIWAMEENKLAKVHTPSRTFLNSGEDKFWIQIEFGMAKKYVDDLSVNVKRGMRARMLRGLPPGRVPIGYLNDKNSREVISDPERFLLVRRMWEYMLTGKYSVAQIHRLASEEWGLRTRATRMSGAKPIAYSAVYVLFSSPFYYGYFLCNGELHKGAHKPMITKSEFDRVQELLSRKGPQRPQTREFAYTGLIKCGECGCSITAENKTNRYGYRYVYYHCTRRKLGVKCRQKSIEVNQLEQQIVAFLESLRIPRQLHQWALSALRDSHEQEKNQQAVVDRAIQTEYDKCKVKLSKLLDLRLSGAIDEREYVDKKNQLETERTVLKERLEDADGRFDEVRNCCEEAFNFAAAASDIFKNGDTDARRSVLVNLGSNLVLRDKKLDMLVPKPFSFMQHALKNQDRDIGRLEPRYFGEDKVRNTRDESVNWDWWALLDEVRTFYLQQLGVSRRPIH